MRIAMICGIPVAALFLTGFYLVPIHKWPICLFLDGHDLTGGLLLRVIPVRGTILLAEIWHQRFKRIAHAQ